MTLLESTKTNIEILKNIHITSQENMIIKSFEKNYENDIIINIFISIINSNSKISIRLIDYFITKFSKKYKINYKLKENDIEQTFNIYTSYKQQLKAYQKKYFDPFSRGDRIPYFMNNICIITTIGQLNFFKWFITKKIYEYVINNYDSIDTDMNIQYKNEKNKINNKIKKNNNYYSTTDTLEINKYYTLNNSQQWNTKNDNIIVSFTF